MKIRLSGHTLVTSNDDKVLFPDDGLTKADLISYYRDVSGLMLPHLIRRCLTLQRFPDGIGSPGFFQQHRSGHFPDFIAGCRLATADGKRSIDHIVVDTPPALVYLADQCAIVLHGWLCGCDRPKSPDRLVFDLDPPGQNPSEHDHAALRDCARDLRELLERCGLHPYVMTTGSRGLHVSAPLDGTSGFAAVRAFARRVAAAVADRNPDRYTVEQRKEKRHGRLYIDVTRNAYGLTAVLPYSLRARPGAPAAAPLRWDELKRTDFSPRRYGLRNMRRRLARMQDPFAEYWHHKRGLCPDEDVFGTCRKAT